MKKISLKKLVAISYFKKIAKTYTQELYNKLKGQQDLTYTYLQASMRNFFELPDNNLEKEKLFPFHIFIIKLLNKKTDILKKNAAFMQENCPWAIQYS